MAARRIVIALDPKRVSPEAIELGHALGLATGAPLTLLAVWRWWEPVELAMIAGEESLREEARKVLRSVGDRLRARGHDVAEYVRAATSVGAALHDAARDDTTGLLILGPAHRGPTGRVLAGSTASSFFHGAPCPIAIPPRGYLPPDSWPRRIGVAYADTDEGHEALRGGAAIARRAGVPLRVVSVVDTRIAPELLLASGYGVAELFADRREVTARAAEAAVGALPGDLTAEAVTLEGEPSVSLADAGRDVDLLVCGSRSYGPLGALLFGSVSRPLLHRTPTPLLVVPRGRERRLEQLLDPLSTAGHAG
jgi:nucleotide-binding universal stress UspA family protein